MLSILKDTVSESLVMLVFIPVPPVKVNVSLPRDILSVPLSDDIPSVVEIVFVPALVIRPFESTVKFGIAVVEP